LLNFVYKQILRCVGSNVKRFGNLFLRFHSEKMQVVKSFFGQKNRTINCPIFLAENLFVVYLDSFKSKQF